METCKFYRQGKCRNGLDCPFIHQGYNYQKKAIKKDDFKDVRRAGEAVPTAAPTKQSVNLRIASLREEYGFISQEEAYRNKYNEYVVRRTGEVNQKRFDGILNTLRNAHGDLPRYPERGGCVVAHDPEVSRMLDDAFEVIEDAHTGKVTIRVHVVDVFPVLRQEDYKSAASKVFELHTLAENPDQKIRLFDGNMRENISFAAGKDRRAVTVSVSYNPKKGEILEDVLEDASRFDIHRSVVRLTARVSHEDFAKLSSEQQLNDTEGSAEMKVVKKAWRLIQPALESNGALQKLNATYDVSIFFQGNKNVIYVNYSRDVSASRMLTGYLLKSIYMKAFLLKCFENHPVKECIPCLLPFGHCRPTLRENSRLYQFLVEENAFVPDTQADKNLSYISSYLFGKTGVDLCDFVRLTHSQLYQDIFAQANRYTTVAEAEANDWKYMCVMNRPGRDFMCMVLMEIYLYSSAGVWDSCQWNDESKVKALLKDANKLVRIVEEHKALTQSLLNITLSEIYLRRERDEEERTFIFPAFSVQVSNETPRLFIPCLGRSIRLSDKTVELKHRRVVVDSGRWTFRY